MLDFPYRKKSIFSLLAIFGVGCGDANGINERDLKSELSNYLSNDLLCIWTGHIFPVDVRDGYLYQVGTQAFIPLVDAGVLSARRSFIEQKKMYESTLIRVPVTKYELTKKGQALAKTGDPHHSGIKGTKFCPAQVEVVEITNYTIPSQGATNLVTTVDYRYQISDMATWGTTAVISLNERLKNAVQAKGESIPRRDSLVRTKNGWKKASTPFF